MYFMRLSMLLLLVTFILCCTRNLDAAARRFNLSPGHVAAFCVLLMALSQFDFDLGAGVSLHPATLLTLVFAAISARGMKETYSVPLAAFFAGFAGWLLAKWLPDAPEIGLVMALPATLAARLLYRRPAAGLLVPCLAPLFFGLCAMLEDWYLYGFASMSFGSALQFDAQTAGAALYALMTALPARRKISLEKGT